MATHSLKTWPAYFEAVASGKKKFEVRKNDRDFKTGDELWLEEFNQITGEYTGRTIAMRVTFVLYGGYFGIDKDYCVLSIEEA